MAYPFFSLAKSKRVKPIDFRAGGIALRVEATVEHGLATIWDADVLIWAASQIVEARDAGVETSCLMRATPYQILTFIGRGTSVRDYVRLKAALDRLQSTTVATSIRQRIGLRSHRFSWISEWKERISGNGAPLGIELIPSRTGSMPGWSMKRSILNIDPALLSISPGASSAGYTAWYASMAAGSGQGGASTFGISTANREARLARFSDFAIDLRNIASRQPLPGYRLSVVRTIGERRSSRIPSDVGRRTQCLPGGNSCDGGG